MFNVIVCITQESIVQRRREEKEKVMTYVKSKVCTDSVPYNFHFGNNNEDRVKYFTHN